MKSISPKCTNEDSFKYSILISLYYYKLNTHRARIKQLEKYLNKYNFESNKYDTFENNYPFISLRVYDGNGKILHKSLNNTNNITYVVQINNNRYYALKPDKNKYTQLNNTLKQFTHKEIADFILNKVSY